MLGGVCTGHSLAHHSMAAQTPAHHLSCTVLYPLSTQTYNRFVIIYLNERFDQIRCSVTRRFYYPPPTIMWSEIWPYLRSMGSPEEMFPPNVSGPRSQIHRCHVLAAYPVPVSSLAELLCLCWGGLHPAQWGYQLDSRTIKTKIHGLFLSHHWKQTVIFFIK